MIYFLMNIPYKKKFEIVIQIDFNSENKTKLNMKISIFLKIILTKIIKNTALRLIDNWC
jgi:hypothetical protein